MQEFARSRQTQLPRLVQATAAKLAAALDQAIRLISTEFFQPRYTPKPTMQQAAHYPTSRSFLPAATAGTLTAGWWSSILRCQDLLAVEGFTNSFPRCSGLRTARLESRIRQSLLCPWLAGRPSPLGYCSHVLSGQSDPSAPTSSAFRTGPARRRKQKKTTARSLEEIQDPGVSETPFTGSWAWLFFLPLPSLRQIV